MEARNDAQGVSKLCLALEKHRRTPEGRVRTSQEMLRHFFPSDEKIATDRVFKFMPKDVRGPILTAWGIRGPKAALRDGDEKVRTVVHDALVAGDIDHQMFEEGIGADVLVRHVPLTDFWAFWRGGKLSKKPLHAALTTAYELGLFDAEWFLGAVASKDGTQRGTDVISDGLTKEDLTAWVRAIRESADGSAKGILSAIGWDKLVAKTPDPVLIAVLDALALKVALVAEAPTASSRQAIPDGESGQTTAAQAPAVVEERSTQRPMEGIEDDDGEKERPSQLQWLSPGSGAPATAGDSAVAHGKGAAEALASEQAPGKIPRVPVPAEAKRLMEPAAASDSVAPPSEDILVEEFDEGAAVAEDAARKPPSAPPKGAARKSQRPQRF